MTEQTNGAAETAADERLLTIEADEAGQEKKQPTPEEKLAQVEAHAKELEADRNREREMRLAAEAKAQEAGEQVNQVRGQAYAAQRQALSAEKEAAQADVEDAQRRWSEAMEQGNFSLAATTHTELTRAANRLERAENGEKRLEHFIERQSKQDEQARQAPRGDAVDTSKFTQPTRDWINNHSEFQTNEKFRTQCFAADTLARADGIAVDTPEYFKFVEDHLRSRGLMKAESEGNGHDPDAEEGDDPQPRRRALSTAAPVGRSAPAANGENRTPTTVRLTPQQREFARSALAINGRTPEQAERLYAEQLRTLHKTGEIGRA